MAAGHGQIDMRQRLVTWFASIRRSALRLTDRVRRDPLPFAGGATALVGIVLLLAAHGRAVPTAPGTTASHPGHTTVIYYPPRPGVGKDESPPTTAPSGVTTPAVAPAPPAVPEWPIEGTVVQGYSWAYDRAAGYWYFHTAWDIQGTRGEQVRAAAAGTVASVTDSPSLGEVIVVSGGNGLSETYGGLGTADVSSGQSVAEGEALGTLGGPVAGEQDGVHLHFAVDRGNQPIDPGSFLPAP